MDSCLMSMAEVCYEIEHKPVESNGRQAGPGEPDWQRDAAVRYLIGSEGFEMNTGWPYHRVLEILQRQKKGPSTLGFVKSIVDAYHGYYADYMLAGQSVDLSACALTRNRLTKFSQALKKLSGLLLQAVDSGNKRIIDAVRKLLGLDEERVYVNVHEYGNTGSATVPFALSEAVELGRVRPGDLVLLTAFGAGFHWAAAALQF